MYQVLSAIIKLGMTSVRSSKIFLVEECVAIILRIQAILRSISEILVPSVVGA